VPADARISVDGRFRGTGTVRQRLDFGDGQAHTVHVARLGYEDRTIVLDGTEDRDDVVVRLGPRRKRVRFVVGPLPGLVKVDGRPVTDGAVTQTSTELAFTVDAAGRWVPHVATAERPGFRPAELTVRFTDSDSTYVLAMRPEQKDVLVTTDPPGAEVFVDGTSYGPSPARVRNLVIQTDPQTNAWVGRRVRAVKPGYAPAERMISWDDGQAEYELKLAPEPGGGPAAPIVAEAATAGPGTPPARPTPPAAPPPPARRPSRRRPRLCRPRRPYRPHPCRPHPSRPNPSRPSRRSSCRWSRRG
jgi:hypothetical protein